MYRIEDLEVVEHALTLILHITGNVNQYQQFSQIADYLYRIVTQPKLAAGPKRLVTRGLVTIFKSRFTTKYYASSIVLYEKLVALLDCDDEECRRELLDLFLTLGTTPRYNMMFANVPTIYITCSATKSTTKVGYMKISLLFNALQNRLKKEVHNELFVKTAMALLSLLDNAWAMIDVDVASLVTLITRLVESKIFGIVPNNFVSFTTRCVIDQQPITESEKFENMLIGIRMLTTSASYIKNENDPAILELQNCFTGLLKAQWPESQKDAIYVRFDLLTKIWQPACSNQRLVLFDFPFPTKSTARADQ